MEADVARLYTPNMSLTTPQAEAVAGDTTAPRITGGPDAAAAPGGKLVITFSEAVQLGSGTLTLTDRLGVVSKINLPAPEVTISGNTLTFDPPVQLAFGIHYALTLSKGAIKDLAGNPADFMFVTFTTALSPTPVNTTGSDAADTIHGSALTDTISGAGGTDWLHGHGGNDVLHGGDESIASDGDVLYGGDGNDRLNGNGGADRQWGEAGNDTLDGGTGADYLDGGDGDDALRGGAGNDTLFGGAGHDTAWYSAARTGYTLERSDGGLRIVDHSGAEGSDWIDGIERIVFSDHAVALDTTGVAGAAYRIYRAAFDRAPDLEGMGYWLEMMDRGLPLEEVARRFVASSEFASLYGSAQSNADVVERLYANVLQRTPDPAGFAYWLDALDSNNADLSAVLAAFSESMESQAAFAEIIGSGIAYLPYGS